MIGSKTRGVVGASAIVVLLLLEGGSRLLAQTGDPIQDAIDKIVKEGPTKEEAPKKDADEPKKADPAPKEPTYETLEGGVKHRTRPDGVEEFIYPNGTKQYVTPDKKKVTIRPNGDRVYQAPDEKPQYRPRKADDPDNYRPSQEPPPISPPSPKYHAPKEPLPDLRLPDPPESRDHAPWSDLIPDSRLPSSLVKPSAEDRPRYTPPPDGADDEVVKRTLTFAKSSVFTYKSGAVQTVFSDGSSLTMYPGLPQANYRDSKGKETTLTPDKDGGIPIPGKGGQVTGTVDPSGRLYLQYPNGTREVVDANGAWGVGTKEGSREKRDENGKLIESSIQDKESGYKIRVGSDGIMWAFDKDGKPVGIGTRGPDGKITVRDADGNEVKPSELVDLTKFPLNNFARGKVYEDEYAKPRKKEKGPVPPSGPTIFDFVSAEIKRRKEQGDLGAANRVTDERLQKIEEAGKASPAKPGAKGEDELTRVYALVDAVLAKPALEAELKRSQERLAARKASLAQEKKAVDAEKVKLLLRETRSANMQKKARGDELSLQVERNGVAQLKIVLGGQDALLKRKEKAAKDDIETALKRIDYSKYHDCPEKDNPQPWAKCGHPKEKRAWLNKQLVSILGAGRVEQMKKLVQQRADLDKQLKELAGKEKDIKERADAAKDTLEKANDQAADLKKQRDRLDARGDQLQKEVDQTQAQTDRLARQVADLDAAIKKNTTPAK